MARLCDKRQGPAGRARRREHPREPRGRPRVWIAKLRGRSGWLMPQLRSGGDEVAVPRGALNAWNGWTIRWAASL